MCDSKGRAAGHDVRSGHESGPAFEPAHPLIDAEMSLAGRRSFLLLGLGLLATACTTGERLADLPAPTWHAMPPTQPGSSLPPRPMPAAPVDSPSLSGAIPRTRWAGGSPVPKLMNPMLPVRYITVHHDGMDSFTRPDESSVKGRLETIRNAHRQKGWGDIGYHFAIDPSGRVWEGRPLRYQGAHVKDRNEGNIGVVVLGNFDRQSVNSRQTDALNARVRYLMHAYNVPVRNVYTHQEWPGAQTACPGRSLEAYMKSARKGGALA